MTLKSASKLNIISSTIESNLNKTINHIFRLMVFLCSSTLSCLFRLLVCSKYFCCNSTSLGSTLLKFMLNTTLNLHLGYSHLVLYCYEGYPKGTLNLYVFELSANLQWIQGLPKRKFPKLDHDFRERY